jgi:phage-related minor tail protein
MQINDELRVVVEAEVDKAIQKLKAFDNSMDKAEKGANSLGAALENQFKGALSARSAITQLGAAVSSSIAVYALASKGVGALTGFVQSSVEAFSEYETVQTNLAVVLGDAERAGAAFEELKAMAAKTPFSVAGLTEAAIQLKQTGTGMQDMTRTLTMLGDAAGGSDEKFRRLVANYAQVQSVGKTTAMDLRQFAQMGLPIYETLRKIGVQGEATGEQVAEAFRLMTSEGGVFFGGMAAGAETLAGKTSTLKDAWRSFQATFAETTGLGQAWKDILDLITDMLNGMTEAMNQESWEAFAGRIAAGAADAGEKVNYFTKEVEYLKWLLEEDEYAATANDEYLQGLRERLAVYEKELSVAVKIFDREKARTAELEKQKELVTSSGRAYEEALATIGTMYAETTAGQIEALEAEIEKLRELREIGKEEEVTTRQYNPVKRQWEEGTKLKTTPLPEDEIRKLDAVIAEYTGKLEKLLAATEKARGPLEDWQKVLKETMGFSDRDVAGGVLDTGAKAVEAYAERIKAAEERIRSLDGLLGDESDLLADTANKWEDLLSAMVASGKWDGTEASFQAVVKNLEGAKQALEDDDYVQKIGALQKKIDDLGKSEKERALEAAGLADAEGKRAETARAMIDEYIAAQEKAAAATKGWEEVFANWVASGVYDIFPNLGEQAAKAIGGISANLASISVDGLLQSLSAVGEAFARGEDAGTAFRDAMGQMAQQILDALPTLFLQAGLQLVAQGQWPMGLGFIAAAGSTALISGYVKGKTTPEPEDPDLNAQGNVFDQALARAYARGGAFTNQVVTTPTYFRHGGGLGLMGEAGPEAIIPLRRMANGDLGVTAESGGGTNVVVNIINNSGAEVRKQEQTDQQGNKQIDVIIGQMIDRHLSSGKADRAMTARYDVKVKGV